jgi:hypothetical protein
MEKHAVSAGGTDVERMGWKRLEGEGEQWMGL